jgi:hypothetical protein
MKLFQQHLQCAPRFVTSNILADRCFSVLFVRHAWQASFVLFVLHTFLSDRHQEFFFVDRKLDDGVQFTGLLHGVGNDAE